MHTPVGNSDMFTRDFSSVRLLTQGMTYYYYCCCCYHYHYYCYHCYEWITNESLLSLSLMLRPTVRWPVCLGIKHPSGAYDQFFNIVWQLRVCWCVALSLTRGRVVVYNCCWPSPAQSFSGPSPVWLVTVFYCLRFETSLFVAPYDSQGHGGGIRPRLHTGYESLVSWTAAYIASRILRKCLLNVRLHGNAFCAELYPRNGHTCNDMSSAQ
jgi:hypothetical protein